ncbi:HK97 family phage prohead protease [Phocaeicola barnesiae]|uniref:HK97 family phage prohead protease n=1 Tax=Phocaeicola barnesiae TaxID=376804 RepID=A0AAW5NAL8_9BACT|nr:HK97 family phage prohead protease [Phocaeicola barnesiae]MCR8874884.1 HK97 family phage prohead protease [Phocaeicola barnesiae]
MKKQNEKEIRNIGDITSANNESRKVEGYALVFNTESEDLGFYETISQSAINEETIRKSDVMCLLDHSKNRGILARSRYGKGSLKLSIDEKGLKYEFDAPRTSLGDELLEMLRRGDINQSSFAFSVATDGDKWEKRDNKYYRTITKIERLFDVSPVYTPAYTSTSVGCRNFDDFKKKIEYIEQLEKEIQDLNFEIK